MLPDLSCPCGEWNRCSEMSPVSPTPQEGGTSATNPLKKISPMSPTPSGEGTNAQRCPQCHQPLYEEGINAQKCPQCHQPLHEEGINAQRCPQCRQSPQEDVPNAINPFKGECWHPEVSQMPPTPSGEGTRTQRCPQCHQPPQEDGTSATNPLQRPLPANPRIPPLSSPSPSALPFGSLQDFVGHPPSPMSSANDSANYRAPLTPAWGWGRL